MSGWENTNLPSIRRLDISNGKQIGRLRVDGSPHSKSGRSGANATGRWELLYMARPAPYQLGVSSCDKGLGGRQKAMIPNANSAEASQWRMQSNPNSLCDVWLTSRLWIAPVRVCEEDMGSFRDVEHPSLRWLAPAFLVRSGLQPREPS